jgi:hypothetical protein
LLKLQDKVCDLGLTLRRSRFWPLLERLRTELRGAGVALWPRFYLSTEYGCVSGTGTVGLLWTDGFADAQRLARARGIRTRSARTVLGVLRHEAGHAFCYVHKLWQTRRFRRLFGVRGGFFATYPDRWHPSAADRRRFARGDVVNLYATRHADEDFATTFEHWVAHPRDWQKRWADKPRVLAKMAYVQQVVEERGWKTMPPERSPLDEPLEAVDLSVDDWMRKVAVEGSWNLLAHHHEPAPRTEAAVRRRINKACLAHGVDYDLENGKRVPISMLPMYLLLSPAEEEFVHRLSERVNHYTKAAPSLYLRHPEVREILPLPEAQDRFLRDCWRPSHARLQTIVSRLDLDMPNDRSKTASFEPNGCAIGGIFYAGAGARVIADVVLAGQPAKQRARVQALTDGCDLVADLLSTHSRALSGPIKPRVGILENRDWSAGITEMPRLLSHLRSRGMEGLIGDPRELTKNRGKLLLRGEPVDVLYRNMELADFVDIEEEDGRPLRGLRAAYRENRVVSGLSGDFDHKSLWELLTSHRTRHLIAAADRRLFRRHLLWTRFIRPTKTEAPDGSRVDLLDFIRSHRQGLVIKPNTSCGGDRVTLGLQLDDRAWNRAVDRALRDPAGWVVQAFHRNTKRRVGSKLYYVTYGVISSPSGCAVLSRASQEPVVNVSRGGGLVGVFARRA